MFSDLRDDVLRFAEAVGPGAGVSRREVLGLLRQCAEGNGLEASDVVKLVSSTYDPSSRQAILEFSAEYRRPHDRDVLLLQPLYFSSICENNCLYCAFSSQGERLSLETFAEEFDALVEMGYRSIELVSGQDPELYRHKDGFDLESQTFSIDGALEYFRLAKKRLEEAGSGMLTSNIPPLDVASMRKLKGSGLDCFLIWLECFNPGQYSRLHDDKGPKANQAFRLDSFEKAIDAGVEHLAGAFLKGLYDWRKEEAALYLLDRYLKQKNGRGFSIIGTPRLKGRFIDSELVNRSIVSDEDYELNIGLDRILFDGILWLQTREPFALNRRLLKRFGGGVILTLSCCTAPGGYSKPPRAKWQFPVYRKELATSVAALEEDGFRVRFDWNSDTLADLNRSP